MTHGAQFYDCNIVSNHVRTKSAIKSLLHGFFRDSKKRTTQIFIHFIG